MPEKVLQFSIKRAKPHQHDWCGHVARHWELDEDTQLVKCECGYIMSPWNALSLLYDEEQSGDLKMVWNERSRTRIGKPVKA